MCISLVFNQAITRQAHSDVFIIFCRSVVQYPLLKCKILCLIFLASLKLEHPVYGRLILFFSEEIDLWLSEKSLICMAPI